MKLRLILFDLGGVIYTSNRLEAVKRFSHLGLKDAEERLNMYTQTGYFGALEEGEISDKEFLIQLSEEAKRPISWNECRHAWLGYATFLPQRNLDLLLHLRQMKMRTALAINTNSFMLSWVDRSDFDGKGNGIRHYLDELFEYILEKEGINGNEVLFIDDSPRNVEAANKLGIHTILAINGQDWTQEVMQSIL